VTGQRANVRDLLAQGRDWGHPEHINELYRLWLMCADATIEWTEELVKRLESGDFVMADDGPDHFGACPVIIKLD
jgi:hypothetical protein